MIPNYLDTKGGPLILMNNLQTHNKNHQQLH